MKVVRNYNAPSDPIVWDKLCTEDGNLLQTTQFDKVNKFYKQRSVYFELMEGDVLVGGVKCFLWESEKLGGVTIAISKRLTQHGETMIANSLKGETNIALEFINQEIKAYINNENIVVFEVIGFYGPKDRLCELPGVKKNEVKNFYTSYVDLDRSEEDLLKSFNRNTRRNILKSVEGELSFKVVDDIEQFLAIEREVYEQQPGVLPPNFDYIRHIYKSIKKENIIIGAVSNGDRDLAGGLFYLLGENAFSVFGGSVRNSGGAGHLFYFELMKKLRKQGVKRFYFGQIAKEYNPLNEKFTVGITNFKRGFRCIEVETQTVTYILKPFRNLLWKILTSIYAR